MPEVPGAKATTGSPDMIQLPPLCSPRDGPWYSWSDTGCLHNVSHTALRRRLPSASHAQSGYWPGLAPNCSAENGGHRPVIHRLLQYLRLSPPGYLTPAGSPCPRDMFSQQQCSTSPEANCDSAFTYHQLACGRWCCSYGT